MFSSIKLFWKTFLLIVSTVIIISAFLGYLTIDHQRNMLNEGMNSKAKTVATALAYYITDSVISKDYSFIVEHAQRIIAINPDIEYLLVEIKNGNILYMDAKSWSMLNELPKVDAHVHDEHGEKGTIVKNIFGFEEVYHASYSISFSMVDFGSIHIAYSLKEYRSGMQTIYRNSFLLFLATLVVIIIASFKLTKIIVNPILKINEGAKALAGGDFTVVLNIDSQDEIGELAKNFNHMVRRLNLSDSHLRKNNEELEDKVKERTSELVKLNAQLENRIKSEVTKRVSQERMLIQQSRFAAMGEMVGNIAHQWRQPLNALGMLLQNIENAYEMGVLDEAYINKSVKKGTQLTQSMSQTIDDFRNFFKPNKEPENFSVASSIDMTMEILRASFNFNMITIHKDIDEKLFVHGFSSEFSQVVLNILNNSKDALLENNIPEKNIFIKVAQLDDNVQIEIRDNAGGIPDKILNNIFDPYFTTKEEGKGTGIGLYMSKTIIENHMNGLLNAQNTDDGSAFTIILKKAPPPPLKMTPENSI